MSDIFISYSSKDRERAKVLAGELEHQGWSVWWDRRIPPGKQFSQVIKEAMDEARCVIVLWSKDSVKSEWVQNEASEGARRKILVPALIDDVEIPFEFRRVQAARLVDWEGRSPHPEFDTLMEALCAVLGKPLLPKASEPIRDKQQPVNEIHTLPKDKPKGDRPMDTTISKEPKKLQRTKVLAGVCIVALIVIVSTGVFLKYRQPKTYSLTVTTGTGGSVKKSQDKTSYNHGEAVTLEAVPNPNYRFDRWSGALSGSTNTITIIIDSDKSVTASFVKDVTVDLIARFDWTGTDEWATRGLDLDTGRVDRSGWRTSPIMFEKNSELTTWCTRASIEQWRLNFTIPFAKIYEESFDSITKERIERELSGDGKKDKGDYTYSKKDIFVFRTVEGRCAKLQIVDWTDRTSNADEEHVRTLTVRYVVYDKDI